MLTFACLSPHPPIILPTVGSVDDRRKVGKTIKALESLAMPVAKSQPEIIIVSSPHQDWGLTVPLHFLSGEIQDFGKNWQIAPYQEISQPFFKKKQKIVYPLITTSENHQKHFDYGRLIARQMPQKPAITWIASGDLSHLLKKEGPYGFHPDGPKFDQEFVKSLKSKKINQILSFEPGFLNKAGECGLRSFCALLGVLEELKINWQPEILSYEGPFGVGYLVANLKIASN